MGASGAAGHLDDGVGEVGVARLAVAVDAGGFAQLVDDGVERDVDLGEVFRCGLQVEVVEPIGCRIAPAPALASQAGVVLVRVRIGVGDDSRGLGLFSPAAALGQARPSTIRS